MKKQRKMTVADLVWFRGFATGLAEMNRRLVGGAQAQGVRAAAQEAGLTLEVAKRADVSGYDIAELERAGVK